MNQTDRQAFQTNRQACQTNRQACQTAPNRPQTRRPTPMQDTLMQVQGILAARRRLPDFRYDQVCALQRRAATLYARNSRHVTLRGPLKKLAAAVDRWVAPYHRRRGVKNAFVSFFEVRRRSSDPEKVAGWFAGLQAARDRAADAGDWESFVNYDNLVEFIRPYVEPDEAELLRELLAELASFAGINRE